MRKIIISAMAPNRAIGFEGRLPWHLPEEYAHFLRSIKGNTMVMGRRSWEVFGADAQTIANIVITRSERVDGVSEIASSLEEAISKAEKYGKDIFIAGGGQIYSEAIEKGNFNEIWLSTVNVDVVGDTFFPELREDQLQCSSRETFPDYVLEKWSWR